MLVKELELPVEEAADYTGFQNEAPNGLKRYLAAALRSGLTENWPDREAFGASTPIIGAEAALLVQNALELTVPTVAGKETDGQLPVWADAAVMAMAEKGIAVEPLAELTREAAAEMLYQVSRLANDLPDSEVY